MICRWKWWRLFKVVKVSVHQEAAGRVADLGSSRRDLGGISVSKFRREVFAFSLGFLGQRSDISSYSSMTEASTGPSINTTACKELKRKSDDVGWKYAYLANANNLQRVKCTLCGKEMSGGIHRLKEHIAGVRGNVQPCSKAKKVDKDKCQKALDELDLKKKAKQHHDRYLREEVNIRRENPIDLDEMQESFGELKSQRSFGPMDKFTSVEKGKGKQTNLENAMRKEQLMRVKEYIARWVYECAIPFHAIETDSFKALLEAVGQFGSNAQPPSRYELGESLLKRKMERTNNRLKLYEDEWAANGCSIMTDCWTDAKRRSIMNLCVNSKSGTVFLSSTESSDQSHTSEHIYDYVESFIQKVGPKNVVQVVTDNASNNIGAAKLLREKRPTIFWTSCGAHTINLMLEGIGKEQRYKSILDKARKITVFIYSHHRTLALMRQYTKKRDIVRPGVTRFASSFLTLQSLLDKKGQLRQMFASNEWEACKSSKTKVGGDVYKLVNDNKFWAGVTSCLSVFAPLVKILRMVDADWKPSMGFLHGELKKAIQEIKDALNNRKSLVKPIMDIILTKMDGRLDSSLHLAAYVLNPYYFYNDISVQNDEIANDAVVEVIERMFCDDFEMQKLIVLEELPIYKSKQGKFSRLLALKGCEKNDDKYDPASWWASFGASTPNLRRVAIRILSLTTSSSGCAYKKKRNRLGPSKLNNLVYVQFNANLLDKNKRRRERGHDTLLSRNDASEAQDWILDEELIAEAQDVNEALPPRRSVRTRDLFEDFESESEVEEVNEEFEYESDGVEILEQNDATDFLLLMMPFHIFVVTSKSLAPTD
ncbi:uncharacterized protein [Rutidosis leptorrhynchoides]|uniref:uncharacterized protein n=1 Tax=Rutidosis leptorrhynchoides TaxID=125765 RepID=UPI003A9A6299